MSIGDNIKRIANQKGITPYRISKDSGVSQSYLSELINNKRNNPTMEIVKAVAKVLGVSVENLVDGGESDGTAAN